MRAIVTAVAAAAKRPSSAAATSAATSSSAATVTTRETGSPLAGRWRQLLPRCGVPTFDQTISEGFAATSAASSATWLEREPSGFAGARTFLTTSAAAAAAKGGRGGGGGSFKSPGKVKEGSAYQTETRKIILSLRKVRKVTDTGKELLRNINLGMYLGAKIGILGK